MLYRLLRTVHVKAATMLSFRAGEHERARACVPVVNAGPVPSRLSSKLFT